MNTIVADIIERVAFRYGFSSDDILGRTRTLMLAKARAEAMLEARRIGFSYPELAKCFRRDHTTVIDACRRAEGRVA